MILFQSIANTIELHDARRQKCRLPVTLKKIPIGQVFLFSQKYQSVWSSFREKRPGQRNDSIDNK